VAVSLSIWDRLRNWLFGRIDPSPRSPPPRSAPPPRSVPPPSKPRAAAHHDNHEYAPVTLSLPRLPRSIAGAAVKRRRADATYTVDLAEWSCTCPYAAARITRYGDLDVRRVCKHLDRLALTRVGVLSYCEPPVAALLERGVWRQRRRYSGVRETQFFVWSAWPSPVYLGITPLSPWVSVATRRKKAADTAPAFTGKYFLFSYNIEERTWAYDTRPPGAGMLRDVVGAMGQRGLLTAPKNEY
jgi:hypothetical protein